MPFKNHPPKEEVATKSSLQDRIFQTNAVLMSNSNFF